MHPILKLTAAFWTIHVNKAFPAPIRIKATTTLTQAKRHKPPDAYANTAASTGTANNHVKFLDADCDTNASAAAALSGEKPPEPYANIIVKAILSTNNNVMQLKDIYNFMIEK